MAWKRFLGLRNSFSHSCSGKWLEEKGKKTGCKNPLFSQLFAMREFKIAIQMRKRADNALDLAIRQKMRALGNQFEFVNGKKIEFSGNVLAS